MKRSKGILIKLSTAVLMILGLVSCNKDVTPIEKAGESTIIENVSGSPTDYKPNEVAYAYLGKQEKFVSYRIDTTGTVLAQKGIINYNQTIHNLSYKKGEDYFSDSSSNSSLLNMRHLVFVQGEKAVYKTSLNGTMNVSEKDDYKEVYGISPDDVALYGYIMNDESIKFAELTSQNDDELTYRFVLDGAKAGNNAIRQMKEFGDLQDYPTYNSLVLYFTLKSDWTPVKLVVESNYNISIAILGDLTCEQNLTISYLDVNSSIEIPNANDYYAKLGTNPSDVITPSFEYSPLIDVVDTFMALDYDKGVHFGLDLGLNCNFMGIPFNVDMDNDLYLKIDQDALNDKDYLKAIAFRLDLNLTNNDLLINFLPLIVDVPDIIPLTNNANLKTISLIYIGDGNLYITFKDKKDVIRHMETIDLIYLIASTLKDVDISSISDSLNSSDLIETLVNAFGISENNNIKTLTLKQNALTSLNLIYLMLLNKIGEKGDLMKSALGTSIKDVKVNISYNNDKINDLELALTTNLDATLNLKLSLKGNLTNELNNDNEVVKAVVEDFDAINDLQNRIMFLKNNMWLGDTYVSRIDSTIEEYKALSASQKALVLNYFMIIKEADDIWSQDEISRINEDDRLLLVHNKLKKKADDFIKDLETIDSWSDDKYDEVARAYSSFNNIQIEYIGKEKIEIYLNKASSHNAK